MYIDTHCHLQLEQFNEDCASVIGNAKKAGVKIMIVPGVDSLSSRLAVEFANQNPDTIYASVGYHPYEASHTNGAQYIESLLRDGSNANTSAVQPIVAIGEIGLDYHLYKGENAEGKKQQQRILFEEQLRMAIRHDLPVIMHCRDAFDDFFSVLDSLPSMPSGVIHCFSGGLQELRNAKDRSLYVGIDGNVTYSKHLQSIVASIPLSMLLLETDSPYLTPIPHRGGRNEPKYLPLVAKHIAEILAVEPALIAKSTTANAQSLFGLSVTE